MSARILVYKQVFLVPSIDAVSSNFLTFMQPKVHCLYCPFNVVVLVRFMANMLDCN